MAKVKMKPKKQEPLFKKGYGEMGKPLRKNYEKTEREMAEVSTLYKKKK